MDVYGCYLTVVTNWVSFSICCQAPGQKSHLLVYTRVFWRIWDTFDYVISRWAVISESKAGALYSNCSVFACARWKRRGAGRWMRAVQSHINTTLSSQGNHCSNQWLSRVKEER